MAQPSLQSGGNTIIHLSHLMAKMWAIWLLNRRDSALSEFSKFVSTDSVLALRNWDILTSMTPFPRDQLDSAVDRHRADNNNRLVHQAVTKSSISSRASTSKPRPQASSYCPSKKIQATTT